MKAFTAMLALAGACTTFGCDAGSLPPSSDDDDMTAPDAGPSDQPDAGPPRNEVRGVWITRFAYSTQAQLEAIIDRAAAANFNAVFVQIRGEGDAYYRSTHEPWSQRLSGVLGRDPGWDPLQVAIDRAHGHGLELHAYFNVFSAWPASSPVPLAEGDVQHALRAHPDWLAVTSSGENADGEYRWFTPGNPAVRAHIVATARELLATYDVDGLHLDRIRTPGPDYSHDAVTEAAYSSALSADPDLTWADFMRSQVDAMVADLYAAVADERPSARLSASVWGIYEPLPGCNTSRGFASYYQDSRGWLADGIIDAIVPMMYWPIEDGSCTDWASLLDGFLAARAGGEVWAGMHALDDNAWQFDRIRARIDYARATEADGTVVFASTYLDQDPARWSFYIGTPDAPGPFAEPAPLRP